MDPTNPNKNENERLFILDSYQILDSLPENEYDAITQLAASLCQVPIAIISLVDRSRVWFKSTHGLDVTMIPKMGSFCAYSIMGFEPFIVENAHKDNRFSDNPIVTGEPNICFYAGVPLLCEEGIPLGNLCVLDHQERKLSNEQLEALQKLSKQVCKLLKLRKTQLELLEKNQLLEQKNDELAKFSQIAAHDLKSPLHNIYALSELLLNDLHCSTEELTHMHQLIHTSAYQLGELIDGILSYSQNDLLLKEHREQIEMQPFLKNISHMLNALHDHEFILPEKDIVIKSNKSALEQILINLISNGIKYNDKDHIRICIAIEVLASSYVFHVEDNGPGIPKEKREKMFELYRVFHNKDRNGKKGNGIGLATVKKLITGLQGSIKVSSTIGKGSCFTFTIPRY